MPSPRKLATPSTSSDRPTNTVPKRPRPSSITRSSAALLSIVHPTHGTPIMPRASTKLSDIGRSPWRSFLDYAFMLHCTILLHFLAQRGSITHHWPRLQRARSLAATLLTLVLEIPFNFQSDMQCAGNANSNVSFQVNASFEQILFLWHTWARSKGLRTLGSEWPDKRDKTRLAVWPGVGENFSRGQPPQDNSVRVGSGVVWVTGLFSLWSTGRLQDSLTLVITVPSRLDHPEGRH